MFSILCFSFCDSVVWSVIDHQGMVQLMPASVGYVVVHVGWSGTRVGYSLCSTLVFHLCFTVGGRLSTTRVWYRLCSALFFILRFMVCGRLSSTRVWYRLCSALFFHFVSHVGWSVIDLPGICYDMSNCSNFVFDLAVDVGKSGRLWIGCNLVRGFR